jgi:hypothetical protein
MGVPLLTLLDDLGPAVLVVDYLEHSAFDLQVCRSFGEFWSAARIGELLDEEHQHFLADIDHVAPLVLLFDDTFGQHRYAADLGVTAVLDSPILRADLLAVLVKVSDKAAA